MEWLFWILAACSTVFLLRIATAIWWKPLETQRFFESQGIRGPPYRLIYGNIPEIGRMITQSKSTPMPQSHDIVPRVIPHCDQWAKTYGKSFISWVGTVARLNVHHPEHIKEILSNKLGNYETIPLDPISRQVVNQGLVGLKGEKWAQHRKILSPGFHMNLLKGMVPTFVECTANMLEDWNKLVLSGVQEVDVLKEFLKLTGDAIAHTAFGSNYEEGKNIFSMLSQQMVLTADQLSTFYIPGFRFLPTRKNRQLWKLEKEIRRGVVQVIESRKMSSVKSGNYGNDLLGILMSPKKLQVRGNLQEVRLTKEEIVAECKTMYLAGHETASTLLTWSVVLLGMHQDWQVQARREVLEVFGKDGYPDVDGLNRLKIMEMILNEALRLYPAAVMLQRQTNEAVKLGSLSIPAGTRFMLAILAIHHDPDLWGNDANEFNPARFSEGVAKAATHPFAFLPFGIGPRICVGQNFTILQAKVLLTMILQRFSFITSPSYTHAPALIFTLQPQYGAQVLLSMHTM